MSNSNVFPFERRSPPGPPPGFDGSSALRTCRDLLELVSQPDTTILVCQACFVSLLINLNDLLMKARKDGRPVTFRDHLDALEKVDDVTDLVQKLRNAVCHINSPLRNIGPSPFSFFRFEGRCHVNANGVRIGCDFDDDIAIYYGQFRIYLRRHIARSIDELSTVRPTSD